MTGKSKTKLLIGVCVPASAMVIAGATTAIVFAIKNKNHVTPVDKKDYTVTFDAGTGSFAKNQVIKTDVYAGTHFDEIDKPIVEPSSSSQVFAGWVDENGNPIMGREPINKNIKLTATYKAVTGEYARITFSSGDSGAAVQGNNSILVNKGIYFFMINRPSVKHPTKYFLNWKYATGTKAGFDVREPDIIFEDVTMVPVLTNTVVMTWDGNGATKTRGEPTTRCQAGTRFGLINQPCFENGTKMFSGWYKDQACTTQWSPWEQVEVNSTAYAKWETTPSEYYCSVSYKKKTGTDIEPIFSPASSQVVLRTSQWSTIFKPTVTTVPADYKVDHWEYSTDGSTDWTTITDTTKLDFDSVYVAPILVPKADDVYIYGDSSAKTESKIKLSAYVLGCSSQGVNWKVYDKPTCQAGEESTIASIDANGNLTINFVGVENKKVYVKATSKVDSSAASEPYPVDIVMPYIDSNLVWYNDGINWYSIDPDELRSTDPTKTKYTAKKLVDESTVDVNKADSFTNKLFIGRNISVILDNFLYGFTGFNGEIDFSIKYDTDGKTVLNSKNNVKEIQDAFMYGCSSFNQYLNLANIEKIGEDFLASCASFNNGGSHPLDLSANTKLASLGQNFLGHCWHFNQEVKLPDGIKRIGKYFLANCVRFSSPLNLPSSIEENGIDDFFMLECYSYASTITVNCAMNAFGGDKMQICSDKAKWVDPETHTGENDPAIYTVGFKVSGTGADDFLVKFPSSDGTAAHIEGVWRTVSKAS